MRTTLQEKEIHPLIYREISLNHATCKIEVEYTIESDNHISFIYKKTFSSAQIAWDTMSKFIQWDKKENNSNQQPISKDYNTCQEYARKVLYQWIINKEIDILRYDPEFTSDIDMAYLKQLIETINKKFSSTGK